MRTIFKFKKMPQTNTEIYLAIMELKSIIDTIREEKSVDDDHDLSLASNHLDSFLDALESQIDNVQLNNALNGDVSKQDDEWCWDNETKQMGFKKKNKKVSK